MRDETGQTINSDEPLPAGRERHRWLALVGVIPIIAVAFLLAGSTTPGRGPDSATPRPGVNPRRRRRSSGNPIKTSSPNRDEANDFMPDGLIPEDIDPVVQATDELIRREALRQLDMLDFDDLDARLTPLADLAEGLPGTVDCEHKPRSRASRAPRHRS